MADSHSLNIIVTTVLTILASIAIILVTLYLIKYDAPPTQPHSIIVAPIEDEEFYIDDTDDSQSIRKSSSALDLGLNAGLSVKHTSTSFNMRPLSTMKPPANLSNVRASWIEICNPKAAPKSNDKVNTLRGLPTSPRPPSFFPPNIDPSASPGLPTSVRPMVVAPTIQEEPPTPDDANRDSSYLTVFEDYDFAQKIIDRKSKVLSYSQQPANRMSFVAGDDSKVTL
ncbi:hypothetical protein E3P99_04064 [Wallemia hederae]|uniref:Uncharacterized protein n=1 Tax=Wallemia hederae TaxID=1540922 RepID=A0A4T0FAY9_9BASI|nr:hypothetical protein E3P99_04064 [Wallemia hederae]